MWCVASYRNYAPASHPIRSRWMRSVWAEVLRRFFPAASAHQNCRNHKRPPFRSASTQIDPLSAGISYDVWKMWFQFGYSAHAGRTSPRWNNNVTGTSRANDLLNSHRPHPSAILTLSETNSIKDTGAAAMYLNLMVRLAGTGVTLVNRNSSNRMSPERKRVKNGKLKIDGNVRGGCKAMTNLCREHQCQIHNPH